MVKDDAIYSGREHLERSKTEELTSHWSGLNHSGEPSEDKTGGEIDARRSKQQHSYINEFKPWSNRR